MKQIKMEIGVLCKSNAEAEKLLELLSFEGYSWENKDDIRSFNPYQINKKEENIVFYLSEERKTVTFGGEHSVSLYLKETNTFILLIDAEEYIKLAQENERIRFSDLPEMLTLIEELKKRASNCLIRLNEPDVLDYENRSYIEGKLSGYEECVDELQRRYIGK